MAKQFWLLWWSVSCAALVQGQTVQMLQKLWKPQVINDRMMTKLGEVCVCMCGGGGDAGAQLQRGALLFFFFFTWDECSLICKRLVVHREITLTLENEMKWSLWKCVANNSHHWNLLYIAKLLTSSEIDIIREHPSNEVYFVTVTKVLIIIFS